MSTPSNGLDGWFDAQNKIKPYTIRWKGDDSDKALQLILEKVDYNVFFRGTKKNRVTKKQSTT
jgi:hypothetical protein